MFDQLTNSINLVGNLAIITTIGLFLSGSCILWFIYGLLIDNKQISIVNGIGFNLEAIYIVIYLFYTQNKKKTVHQILFVILIKITAFFYAFGYEEDKKQAAHIFGYLGSLASILMFGSPLSSIKNVMKSQSTESLSFLLCLANFSCSSLWSIYGILIKDNFVLVPNIIGALLGFAQISLFAKFPSQSISNRNKFKSDDPIL